MMDLFVIVKRQRLAESRLVMHSWFTMWMFMEMVRVMMFLKFIIEMKLVFECQWLAMNRLIMHWFFLLVIINFLLMHCFPIWGIILKHWFYMMLFTIPVWIENKICTNMMWFKHWRVVIVMHIMM